MWALASAAQLGCLPARIISTPSGAPILRGFMRMRTLIPVRRAHCPRVPHTSMTAHRASAWRWFHRYSTVLERFHCEVSREQECRWNIYAAQRISSFVARIRCGKKSSCGPRPSAGTGVTRRCAAAQARRRRRAARRVVVDLAAHGEPSEAARRVRDGVLACCCLPPETCSPRPPPPAGA